MPQFRQFAIPALSVAFLLILSLRLSGQEDDSYLKSLLNDYYRGRIVRAKVAIPADRKGLQIVDGQIRRAASDDARFAVQPGEPLLIAGLHFRNKSIEVEFDGGEIEPPTEPGKKLNGSPRKPTAPRLHLQFDRQITIGDLNIQTINRFLSAAVDISALRPEKPAPPASAVSGTPRASAVSGEPASPGRAGQKQRLAERRARAGGIPTAPSGGNEILAEPGIAELTVECSGARARLYIDGAFSGYTPRTIRIRAGTHAILVICDRCAAWEREFYIPAGKASLIRACGT